MEKSADAFRSIGEVSRLIGVAPHVLRYWETQFSEFRPVKRRDGRRYYRPDDVRLAAGLREVLKEDGLTIRGAKKLIAADRGASLRARGAERLGEAAGAEPPAQPVTAKAPGTTRAPRNGSSPPAPASPRPSPTPAAGGEDWLARLSQAAAQLRDWPIDQPLPAPADELHRQLSSARLSDVITAQ